MEKECTPTMASKHLMVNNAYEILRSKEENSQRYDELKKLFHLLKEEWPECFDNTLRLYKLQAQIAVS